jgi:poly-gamma-glutamate capsule biosynthesis protein CapA/YwtB (metallophosphatase superfamily)
VAAGLLAIVGLGRAPAARPPQKQAIAPIDPRVRPVGSVSIAAVGDMTFGHDGIVPPGGARALLSSVVSGLRSDLAVGNLETTLGAGGSSKCSPSSTSCFRFQAPTSTAAALRQAGIAAVNVANNHSYDYGLAGQVQTSAALQSAHIAYTGRPGQTTYLGRHGIRIALLGFAPGNYNQNLLDLPAAVELVDRASTRADFVVVFIHAGAEGQAHQHVRPGMEMYLGEQRGDPIRFAHAVVDAGADLVLGSGPHVLRAMEWYRGRLIAYSLGNFSGYKTLRIDGVSGISGILRIRLRADGSFAGGTLVPLRLVGFGTPTPDPSRAAVRIVNTLSRSDFRADGVRLLQGGQLKYPATAGS